MAPKKDEEKILIDLSRYGGPVYSGRSRGEVVRDKLGLDQYDKSGQEIVIEVPENTYSITSSFFLGLFGRSIVYFGSKDLFLKKYEFIANELLLNSIDKYINIALLERK
jgi:hypothetical protein